MNAKGTIKKFLFIALWVAIGGSMLVLLIAAIGKQKRDHCKDYSIKINSTAQHLFVDDNDILKMLKVAAKGDVKGQKKSSINLLQIEQQLESNVWIKDAELYFDNRDVLHVIITESEPVARVFTTAGKSFYIDGSEKMLPLTDKQSAKVPVFTDFPAKVISKRDSALLHNVKLTAQFILANPFWMAQVAQIDINSDRNFEMTPVVGNHTVLLGDGENIEDKFHRLFVFYKNVMSQTGFDKYKTINVQYAGQVIGARDRQGSKIDTSQLRLNVEKLLREARDMQNDSLIAAREIKDQKAIRIDPDIAATDKSITDENRIVPVEGNVNPVLVTSPAPMKPFSNSKKGGKENPKALMKARP